MFCRKKTLLGFASVREKAFENLSRLNDRISLTHFITSLPTCMVHYLITWMLWENRVNNSLKIPLSRSTGAQSFTANTKIQLNVK